MLHWIARSAKTLLAASPLLLIGSCTDPVIGYADATGYGDETFVPRSETPTFATEVVLFEDGIRTGEKLSPLVYRAEGTGAIARDPSGRIMTMAGPSGIVHAAQYRRATLQTVLEIEAGEPLVAIADNGQFDRSGNDNPDRGIGIRLGLRTIEVVSLASDAVIAQIDVALPRHEVVTVSIAWDVAAGLLRVDVDGGSYEVSGVDLPLGGFGVRLADDESVTLHGLRVLWQDDRFVRLYNGYDSLFDLEGNAVGTIPPAALPPDVVTYSTISLDVARGRSLLLLGGADLNVVDTATIKGYAVRDLATGTLDLLDQWVGRCYPLQGGTGFDGVGMYASTPTQSQLWIDWNAYDRGAIDEMCEIERHSTGDLQRAPTSPFLVYADPANALDGSIGQFVRLTEQWQGVTHLSSHPRIRPFAGFDEIALPGPSRPEVSHTGPGARPTQLAVRDRDRVYHEEWSYPGFWQEGGGSNLHVQNRGFNLFTGMTDMAGPAFPTDQQAEAFSDWANMTPSLTQPGVVLAPRFRFSARETGAQRIVLEAVHWLGVETKGFVEMSTVAAPTTNAADVSYPLLWP